MKIKNLVIAIIVIALGGMIAFRITKNKAENDKGNDKTGHSGYFLCGERAGFLEYHFTFRFH